MATLLIAEPVEAKTLTAADIIESDRYYGAAEIETLLAIPPREFLAAIHQMNYGFQGDINVHGGVSGVDVLRCIAKHDLKHRVTTLAREVWARNHCPPAVETPEPEAKDLASRIVRQADSEAASECAEEDARKINAFDALLRSVYQAVGEGEDDVAKLARSHLPKEAITASDGDVRDCTDAMLDLKIDAETFREHVETMRKALEQTLLHDGRPAALKAKFAASEDMRAFTKSSEARGRTLFRAKVAADNRYRRAHNAAYELSRIRKVVPEAFFAHGRPRQLVS